MSQSPIKSRKVSKILGTRENVQSEMDALEDSRNLAADETDNNDQNVKTDEREVRESKSEEIYEEEEEKIPEAEDDNQQEEYEEEEVSLAEREEDIKGENEEEEAEYEEGEEYDYEYEYEEEVVDEDASQENLECQNGEVESQQIEKSTETQKAQTEYEEVEQSAEEVELTVEEVEGEHNEYQEMSHEQEEGSAQISVHEDEKEDTAEDQEEGIGKKCSPEIEDSEVKEEDNEIDESEEKEGEDEADEENQEMGDEENQEMGDEEEEVEQEEQEEHEEHEEQEKEEESKIEEEKTRGNEETTQFEEEDSDNNKKEGDLEEEEMQAIGGEKLQANKNVIHPSEALEQNRNEKCNANASFQDQIETRSDQSHISELEEDEVGTERNDNESYDQVEETISEDNFQEKKIDNLISPSKYNDQDSEQDLKSDGVGGEIRQDEKSASNGETEAQDLKPEHLVIAVIADCNNNGENPSFEQEQRRDDQSKEEQVTFEHDEEIESPEKKVLQLENESPEKQLSEEEFSAKIESDENSIDIQQTLVSERNASEKEHSECNKISEEHKKQSELKESNEQNDFYSQEVYEGHEETKGDAPDLTDGSQLDIQNEQLLDTKSSENPQPLSKSRMSLEKTASPRQSEGQKKSSQTPQNRNSFPDTESFKELEKEIEKEFSSNSTVVGNASSQTPKKGKLRKAPKKLSNKGPKKEEEYPLFPENKDTIDSIMNTAQPIEIDKANSDLSLQKSGAAKKVKKSMPIKKSPEPDGSSSKETQQKIAKKPGVKPTPKDQQSGLASGAKTTSKGKAVPADTNTNTKKADTVTKKSTTQGIKKATFDEAESEELQKPPESSREKKYLLDEPTSIIEEEEDEEDHDDENEQIKVRQRLVKKENQLKSYEQYLQNFEPEQAQSFTQSEIKKESIQQPEANERSESQSIHGNVGNQINTSEKKNEKKGKKQTKAKALKKNSDCSEITVDSKEESPQKKKILKTDGKDSIKTSQQSENMPGKQDIQEIQENTTKTKDKKTKISKNKVEDKTQGTEKSQKEQNENKKVQVPKGKSLSEKVRNTTESPSSDTSSDPPKQREKNRVESSNKATKNKKKSKTEKNKSSSSKTKKRDKSDESDHESSSSRRSSESRGSNEDDYSHSEFPESDDHSKHKKHKVKKRRDLTPSDSEESDSDYNSSRNKAKSKYRYGYSRYSSARRRHRKNGSYSRSISSDSEEERENTPTRQQESPHSNSKQKQKTLEPFLSLSPRLEERILTSSNNPLNYSEYSKDMNDISSSRIKTSTSNEYTAEEIQTQSTQISKDYQRPEGSLKVLEESLKSPNSGTKVCNLTNKKVNATKKENITEPLSEITRKKDSIELGIEKDFQNRRDEKNKERAQLEEGDPVLSGLKTTINIKSLQRSKLFEKFVKTNITTDQGMKQSNESNSKPENLKQQNSQQQSLKYVKSKGELEEIKLTPRSLSNQPQNSKSMTTKPSPIQKSKEKDILYDSVNDFIEGIDFSEAQIQSEDIQNKETDWRKTLNLNVNSASEYLPVYEAQASTQILSPVGFFNGLEAIHREDLPPVVDLRDPKFASINEIDDKLILKTKLAETLVLLDRDATALIKLEKKAKEYLAQLAEANSQLEEMKQHQLSEEAAHREEIGNLENQVKDLRAKLGKEENKSLEYESDLSDLKKRLNQEKSSRERLSSDLQQAQKRIDELEKNNKEKADSPSKNNEDFERMSQISENAQQELKESRNQVERLQNRVKMLEKEVDQLYQEKRESASAVQNRDQNLSLVSLENDNLKTQIKTINTQHQILQSDYEKVKKELFEAKQEIFDLKQQEMDGKLALDKYTREISHLKLQLEQSERNFMEQARVLHDMNTSFMKLRNRMQSQKDDQSEYLSAIISPRGDLDQFQLTSYRQKRNLSKENITISSNKTDSVAKNIMQQTELENMRAEAGPYTRGNANTPSNFLEWEENFDKSVESKSQRKRDLRTQPNTVDNSLAEDKGQRRGSAKATGNSTSNSANTSINEVNSKIEANSKKRYNDGEPSFKDLEKRLLNLQIQKDELNSELEKLDRSKTKSVANLKRKQQIQDDLSQIYNSINSIKLQMREVNILYQA